MAEETAKQEEVKEETAAPAEETKEETKEVPAKFKGLVDQISELSVLELSELVKVLEDHFGVSAAAPVAVAAAGGAAGVGASKSPATIINTRPPTSSTVKIFCVTLPSCMPR